MVTKQIAVTMADMVQLRMALLEEITRATRVTRRKRRTRIRATPGSSSQPVLLVPLAVP